MTDFSEQELAVFSEARQLPASARSAYLASACKGNPAFQQGMAELLQAYDEASSFLVSPDGLADSFESEKPGDQIGLYTLLQPLGEGGCGIVYRASQEKPVRREVALKVIKLGMDTKEVIARFGLERQALALMEHPSIAKVLDAGATEAGRPYFVMELVRGVKITEYCDQNNLSVQERLELFMQVCQAIQHAHQKGIIHRDIKPSNILVTMVNGAPVPKVIDFGIAKATHGKLTDQTLFTACELFMGTPAYMSPEQAEMSVMDVDTRSDIYSLGVLLYELLTGQTPFDARALLQAGFDEIRRTIRLQEPARPSACLAAMTAADLSAIARRRKTDPVKLIHLVRGDLNWIAMKALEKDRTRRYATANGLARDIQRHLHNDPVVARPPSNVYRFQKLVRRNKLAFAASAAIILSLSAGLGISLNLFVKERKDQRLTAQAERQAEAAATEAKSTLAAADFSQAMRLIEADDGPDAVAYLSRVLSSESNNTAALAQLSMLLSYRSWMIPALRLKHNAPVSSAHFSPDGNRIVTVSRDNTACVWDAKSGQLVAGPLRHQARINSAHFSPDGKWIVTASMDSTVRVWNAQTGQEKMPHLKLDAGATCAEFNFNGTRIATGTDSGSARVWSASNGAPLTPEMNGDGDLRMVHFSPDGTHIVTCYAEYIARVWNALDGRPVTPWLRHGGSVWAARFSPDGARIVTSAEDRTVHVWDVLTGLPAGQTITIGDVGWDAEFSPDGTQLVTASRDNTARIWNAKTGVPLTEPFRHRNGVGAAHFSPDGRRVVTASRDNTAQLWDAQTGKRLMEPLQHGGGVNTAEFSPDGSRILTASDDGSAWVWEEATGRLLTEPMIHDAGVISAQFSPDGKIIATTSYDYTARLWDARTGRQLTAPLKHKLQVESAQFSLDGTRLLTASDDYTAQVWDVQSGHPLFTKPPFHQGVVISARFSPDEKRIATASYDRTARIWDAHTGLPLTGYMMHHERINSVRFSPDGTRIVTASYDGTAQIWNAQTGQPVTAPLHHGYLVFFADFSPDGKEIVTASEDHTLMVWDAKTGHALLGSLEHGDGVNAAHFSADGRYLLSASRDNTARLWDARNAAPLTPPLTHDGWVWDAQFSPSGEQIVTCSWDGTARVWDSLTGQPLSQPFKHKARVYSANFSPDGKRVVTGSTDHTARIWDVKMGPAQCPDWLLPLAEALSGNRLDKQGHLERTSLDRAQAIAQIRQTLASQPDAADGVQWGRWLLADRFTRTISPFSSSTLSDYVDNRIAETTKASFDEAEQLAVGNNELVKRVATARQKIAVIEPILARRDLAQSYVEAGRREDVVQVREELMDLEHSLNRPEDEIRQAMEDLISAYEHAGHDDKAILLLEKSLAQTNSVLAQSNTLAALKYLSSLYDKVGRRADGLKMDEEILARTRIIFGPESGQTLAALKKLIISCKDSGQRDLAVKFRSQMTALLVQKSDLASAAYFNNMAWMLAASDDPVVRDGPTAVKLAEIAVNKSQRKIPSHIDTLAAAYAETGQFEKSAVTEQEAIELEQNGPQKKVYTARLQLYQAHQPYHAAPPE